MGLRSEARVAARGAIAVRWDESPAPELSDELRRAVDEVWQRARAERGDALHDSPILAYRGHEVHRQVSVVTGVYLPYRYYYARQHLGDVGVDIDPIGVNGMTLVSEGSRRFVVLGRRSPTVTYYPGCWECVPSGGLDRRCARPDGTVDFASMVLEEFEEELCLPREQARVGCSFGLVYDVGTRTYDVWCPIKAACSRSALADAAKQSGEYSEITFVAEDDLTATVEQLGEELIPTARPMIDLWRETR